jgi:hypothetical protein
MLVKGKLDFKIVLISSHLLKVIVSSTMSIISEQAVGLVRTPMIYPPIFIVLDL